MIRAIVAGLLLTGATAASAQSVTLTPSFATTELYDDNVFYRPDAEGDVISRFTPGLDARYLTERVTVAGHYTLDADRFASHSELTTAHARQDGGFDAAFQSSRRLSFSATAAFFESQTPADLNLATGLAPGRVRAARVMAQPSTTYAIDPNTDLTAAYTMTSDRLAGGVSLLAHTGATTVGHRLSDRNGVKIQHTYQLYQFDINGAAAARTSQTITVEWTHAIDRRTTLSVLAGPRVTDGIVSPEIAASVRRQRRGGDASLAYVHTQTTLIGLAGTADTHSLTATFSGDVHRRLTLHAGPGVLYTRQGPQSSVVYRLSLSCARPLTSRLAIEAAYDANVQRGNIYSGLAVDTIDRNVALLRLVVGNPTGQSTFAVRRSPFGEGRRTANGEPETANRERRTSNDQ